MANNIPITWPWSVVWWWTTQTVPFWTPQIWIPQATTAPISNIQWRWATTLFSDEQQKMNQMLQDWLSEEKARELITMNRKRLLKNISKSEGATLRQMAADGLDTKTSVEVIKKIRRKNMPLWKKAAKIPFDVTVWELSLASEQVWNLLDFTTMWRAWFWEQVAWIQEVTQRSFVWEPWFQAWRTILWAWELLAISPTQIAPTLWGRTLQAWAVWAWIWWIEPILERWAEATLWEIATGAAIWWVTWAAAVPVLEKTVIPALSWTIKKVRWATQAIREEWIVWAIKKPFVWKWQAAAEALSTKANRFNAKDIEDFTKITWENPWEFAVTRGMKKTWGEAVEEAVQNFSKSIKEADEWFELIEWRFKFTWEWDDALLTMLDDLEWRLVRTKNPKAKRVTSLKTRYDQWLTMSEINELKRLYAKNFKYTWADASSEAALKSTNLQNSLRQWQFEEAWRQWFTNIAEINKNTQGWKAFWDMLGKKLKRSSWNNAITLTDWITLSWWEPANLWLYLGKKAWQSKFAKELWIKALWKKTKEPIIKASKEDILKANVIKKHGIDTDIRAGVTDSGLQWVVRKPLQLPAWQTTEAPRTIIRPRKQPIVLKEKPTKTIVKTVEKPEVKIKWLTFTKVWKLIDKAKNVEELVDLKKQITKSWIRKDNKEKLITKINEKIKSLSK